MVTAKRKINNEKERYGGFSEIEVSEPRVQYTTTPVREVAPKPVERTYVEPKPQYSEPKPQNNPNKSFYDAQVQAAEERVSYSQFQAKPQQKTTVEQPIADTYKPPVETFMPSIRSQKDHAPAPVTKQKLDQRTKVILGVYLTIILLLSALVLATGILLSSAGSRVDDLEDELSQKTAAFNTLRGEIDVLSDESNIADRAVGGGMVAIESAKEYDLLPLTDASTYPATTNWFDSVCDWLSGVFGG